jgi:tetratricopeptide (TPR) repeat protein
LNSFSRIACCLLLALIEGPARAEDKPASLCVAPSFTYDADAALRSCSAQLENDGLTAAERARILTLRGRTLKVKGKLDAAIRDFDAALALQPDAVDILLARGWAAVDKRDFEAADAFVKRALARDPENSAPYDITATAAFLQRDYGVAKRFYDKAIALNPNDVLARFNRLIFYKLRGYHSVVVAQANAILALNSPELDTLYATLQKKRMTYRTMARLERTLIWETMGQTEQAEKAFDDWVAVEPNAVSYGYRAAFRERHEHYESALTDLDKAMADDPNFWLLYHTQGRVYYYTRRDEEAVRALTRAIELNPGAGISYWLRAVTERRLNRTDAALKDALKAVAVDRGVRALKVETLTKLGYLQIGPNDAENPLPALAEAVQACMLDEGCW